MSITLAFIKKEFLQILRDPSSLIIAFVLPTLLLFIYAYGINLDSANVRLGIKNDDDSPATEELVKAFGQNRFITAVRYADRKQMQADLTRLRGAGVRTQLYTEQKKFKAKMNYADKIGVPYVIFLGDDEIAAGVVACKDMKTGEQTKLPFAETLDLIRSGLAEKNKGTVILE